MSEVWSAEHHVDEALAAELIREQFAPLPRRSVEVLSEGWDYVVHRVDDDWVFRFPRREVVVTGTERELAVLPLLAELLPIAVPDPVHVGRPSDAYPWPFYGARFLPGVELGEARLDDDARTALARPLAQALRALHAPQTLAAVGGYLPVDLQRRADMPFRVGRTREALAGIAALWKPPPLVEDLLEQAVALPPAEPTAVCHADLHFRQLLVGGGELSGLIDWIDVCRADPGIDLQLAWSFLPPAGRHAFLDEYGPVADASLARARVLAIFLNAILLRYGQAEGVPTIAAEALASLDRTVA
jgi:aminoglycoside phosphotransferase (APT) family kinase protein